MSLHLANDFLPTRTENTRTPTMLRGAMRLFALALRLRPRGMIPPMTQSGRLSATDLRDVGLSADHIRQAPIWGHGGIMWRP
ncbi:hypothetical protein [Neoroseomonas rubea]|uniref:hypothetical protein n=1 Tax=Neoroseomonas rubea TaxID=2748666 RepID=UPI0018E02BD5|nr:hypothetical protein [Roseomonas rubea]